MTADLFPPMGELHKRCPKRSDAHGAQCEIWEGHRVPCVYFTGEWSEEQIDVVKAEVAIADLVGYKRGLEEASKKLPCLSGFHPR